MNPQSILGEEGVGGKLKEEEEEESE
uniref:Uncharacterized protein n=1 Tax=Arundo donax TaxID=35708 RepID=A0A0A9A335_ARUDO